MLSTYSDVLLVRKLQVPPPAKPVVLSVRLLVSTGEPAGKLMIFSVMFALVFMSGGVPTMATVPIGVIGSEPVTLTRPQLVPACVSW